LIEHLDDEVGRGDYVVIVTSDHGQQPDEDAIDGYGIDPYEVQADINARFGPVALSVRPTEVFLDEAELAERDVSVAEVAEFLRDYRLRDNADGFVEQTVGAGRFSAGDRIFDLAVPAPLLTETGC